MRAKVEARQSRAKMSMCECIKFQIYAILVQLLTILAV